MTTHSALTKPHFTQKLPPGPRGLPVIGVAPQVLKNPLNFFMEIFQQYGDVVHFQIGATQFYQLNHPDHIQWVLQENNRNYHKSPNYEKLRPLLGNGLIMSEDSFWLRQRRLMQPAFHRKRLAALSTVMTQAAETMLERWQPYTRSNQPLNVADEFMRVTLDVVSRAMFSTSTSDFSDRVARNLPIILEHTNRRFWEVVDLSRWPTPGNRRYRQALRELDQVVYRVIEQRRSSGEMPDDLMTMLIEARDADNGEQMNDVQLRDEVMTIYLAGHETTANALSWAQYLLAQHPHLAEELRHEVDTVLQGRVPTTEDFASLRYTRMVLDETMRIYPSIWSIARTPLVADEVGGYTLPPGANVGLTPYVTHRHPEFWDHPATFDPERFSPEKAAKQHPYAYFPFGGGPRLCIGNNFALMEATFILAMIMQRYRLELVEGQSVEMQPVVTLRPKDGIYMKIYPRQ